MTETAAIVWNGPEALRPFLVPVDELEPWPGNPNVGDVEEIRGSLKRFGQVKMMTVDPLVSDPPRIVTGHHVRLAAIAEGWTHIAVMPHEFGSEDEARAYLIADNRLAELGTIDESLLDVQLRALRERSDLHGTGFTEQQAKTLAGQLERIRRLANARNADKVPPAPKTPITQPGEIFELGSHRLMCGDSTNPAHIAALLGDDPVPLIFTSPPYGVGLDYGGGYEDTIDNARTLIVALATLWRDHVAGGGYCLTNFADVIVARGYLESDEPAEYPMALEYWPPFADAGWLLNTRRVWAKPHARVAAPWTANSNRAACDWEHLWTWKRPGPGLTARRDRSPYGVWDTSHAPNVDVGKETHPAGFPTELPRWALEVYSEPGDRVADPFAGTGTTMIAGELTMRPTLLMELSPVYCDIIRQRYADFMEQPELAAAPAIERVEIGEHKPPEAQRSIRLGYSTGRMRDVENWLEIVARELELDPKDTAEVMAQALRRAAASF